MIKYALSFLLFFGILKSYSDAILIPMDEGQKDHLKAYGMAYWSLTKDVEVDWLLNYRGGSFLIPSSPRLQLECKIRNISFEVISENEAAIIREEVQNIGTNTDLVKLQKG
jgi:hypothetical protein